MRLRSLMSVACDEQAQHLVAIALRGARNNQVPPEFLGIRKLGFKHLHLALQGFGQQLFGLLEAFGPQQIAHVHSVQLSSGTPNQVSWAWLPKRL